MSNDTETRKALAELLTIVRASTDPVAATTDLYISPSEELRRRAARIDREDQIIWRAREALGKTD